MSDKNTSSALQGLTRIIIDATLGTTDIVESMHRRIVYPPLLPATPIQRLITGIAAITYKNIRWSTRLIGKGIEKILGKLEFKLGDVNNSPKKEVTLAILNGVVGDYLDSNNNPLAIKMNLRNQGRMVNLEKSSINNHFNTLNGKILVLVHGSCMNDIQWTRGGHNHGTALADKLEKTPIYLHYNSGRHISLNGKDFSELLEKMVSNWPVPVEEISIVGHSMGGLVSRSAYYYGQLSNKTWTSLCKKMVFIGTPHHGAPLERIGNYIDNILDAIPYTSPLSPLVKIRSAGITDLRYGHITDEDWKGKDRFELNGDLRKVIQLPSDVECYTIVGVTGKIQDKGKVRFKGDKMVSMKSALGKHKDPDKNLNFKKGNTWISEETSHSELLNDIHVFDKLASWLR